MKGIWKYDQLLPTVQMKSRITLGEGDTPLIHSRHIGTSLGLENLFFKLEMVNPSGSYKDRFACLAVSKMVEDNIPFCVATSSGNTGAALAAYCAAAGIKCYLAIVDGAPSGKLQQMRVYGAETLMIKGFGLEASVTEKVMDGLTKLAAQFGSSVQISAFKYSPIPMQGVQTIAYEVAEELSEGETHLFSPSGGGGLTLAMVKGFRKWKETNKHFQIPKVHCVQPVGNNSIAGPLRTGLDLAQEVPNCTTHISGLQVPNVIDGNETLGFCRSTGGTGYVVEDELVYQCQESLSLNEGIFCEPAGAVALAGLVQAVQKGEISSSDQVVCLVTGHGFKDPVSAIKISDRGLGQYFDTAEETFKYLKLNIDKKK
ncbi:MAG: pyridoxal-phosphate dependent enzyme [Ginsengibacter sp.]